MAKTNNQKALVIVESPAKSKIINKYLGSDYQVTASMGHVRDLPSKGINVDLENGFEPTYDIMPGKKRIVSTLKAAAKNCDCLYLATDLDREGEAIAWHLAQILKFPTDKTYRVVFNEITKTAIKKAFENPGKLNQDKVMAQQARRILDRIVGYQISPLLWKKVARGLSAGRVQSVAVKLVVEKERQIRAFVPEEYWLIPAVFTTDIPSDYGNEWTDFITPENETDKAPVLAQQNHWLQKHNAFKAELATVDGKKFHAEDKKLAMSIYQALKTAAFHVSNMALKRTQSKSSPPFITSTLQQAAANRLSFSAKRTMRLAQQLYEGVDLGSMGMLGLITYMRTDSTHLSAEAIKDTRHYIQSNIGPEYLPEKPNFFSAKKNAQQAHEAIRVTDPDLTPDGIKDFLTDEQFKLYDLIWRRSIACQMAPSKWDVTNLEITAETPQRKCVYRANGRVLVFDGFTKVWPTSGSTHQQLPEMHKDQKLEPVDITAQQHFTKPPPRYNEASLVKELEKEGIGRPSTYATIISTIQDRRYVEQVERKFYATDLGEVVTEKLDEFFPRIMDISFTRYMEDQLDKIEDQNLDWIAVLTEFYEPFKDNLTKAAEHMKHAKAELKPSEYTCTKCGKPMVYRFGKNGKFLSCSDYPNCTFASPCDREGKMVAEPQSDHKCPNCSKPMIVKSGRFGSFLGCSDYPNCKTILNIDKDGNVLPPKPPPEPTGIKCYKCSEGLLVIRQSKRGPFLGCNRFPKCRTIISMKQLDNLKQLQQQGVWPPDSFEKADEILGRKKKNTKKPVRKKKVQKKARQDET